MVERDDRYCESENDPAARSSLEVLLTLSWIKALAVTGLSHFLWNHGCKLLISLMQQSILALLVQIDSSGAQIASGTLLTTEVA